LLGIRYHGAGIIDGDADPQPIHPQSCLDIVQTSNLITAPQHS
jgi:hypothetical protein